MGVGVMESKERGSPRGKRELGGSGGVEQGEEKETEKGGRGTGIDGEKGKEDER